MSLAETILGGRLHSALVDFGVQILRDGRRFVWYVIDIGVAVFAFSMPDYRDDDLICVDFIIFSDVINNLGPPGLFVH